MRLVRFPLRTIMIVIAMLAVLMGVWRAMPVDDFTFNTELVVDASERVLDQSVILDRTQEDIDRRIVVRGRKPNMTTTSRKVTI
jgi:hypothetical protein